MGKANLTREQKSRLLEAVEAQTDDLRAQNEEREKYLATLGMGVSPLTRLAAMVEACVRWTAPTEYQRARFDLDVERCLENAMSDENVGVAKGQMQEAQDERERMAREMALAEQGRRESGLYVPESAAAPLVAPSAGPVPAVVPEPSTIPTDQTIRPPSPPRVG